MLEGLSWASPVISAESTGGRDPAPDRGPTMLAIRGASSRLCDGSSRRDFLRVGSIAGLGLGLPPLLRSASATPPSDPSFGRAKRCILLFPFGGPS